MSTPSSNPLADVVENQISEIERLRRQEEFRKKSVCLGLDVMRILMGLTPNNYSLVDAIRILSDLRDERSE